MAVVPNLLGRRDYSRDEVYQLHAAGLLPEKYELIDGEIINRMGQSPPHTRTIARLSRWLRKAFGDERVRDQFPIEVAESDRSRNDLIPDLVVVAEDKTEYEERHPRGDELLVAVEVSDTSLALD